MIKLGQKAKDRITGFAGTITGKVEYITGCNQVLLASLARGNSSSSWVPWASSNGARSRAAGKC